MNVMFHFLSPRLNPIPRPAAGASRILNFHPAGEANIREKFPIDLMAKKFKAVSESLLRAK